MSDNNSTSEERHLWRRSRTAAIVVIAIALLVSLVIFKPAMPKKIVLLTGPEGSSYHELGKMYATYLNGQGLQTEVKATTGGLDNLGQLAAGAHDAIGFAPSNIEHVVAEDSVDIGHLESLGSVAWEPLWLFYRADLAVRRIPDLAGLTVAIGAHGTVIAYLAKDILRANGILNEVQIRSGEEQTPEAVAQALAEGTIDAAFVMGGPASPIINDLLLDETTGLLSFERANAYQARKPGIAKIVVPEGVFDLARNIPPEDLVLISATTNLVTLDSLHPGTVPLLLRAATKAHDRQSFTTASESFPNGTNLSLPLKRAAARYYDHGETLLGKYLPYKVTRWIDHLGFVVMPLLVAAFLFFKTVPVILRVWWQVRLIGLLKRLEKVEKAHAMGGDRSKLLADLDLMDQKSAKMFVPRSSAHDFIDFRQFLHDMRERVENA